MKIEISDIQIGVKRIIIEFDNEKSQILSDSSSKDVTLAADSLTDVPNKTSISKDLEKSQILTARSSKDVIVMTESLTEIPNEMSNIEF